MDRTRIEIFYQEHRTQVFLALLLAAILVFAGVIFLLPGHRTPTVPAGFTNDTAPKGRLEQPTFTPIPTPTPVPLVQGPQTYTISNTKKPSMYEVHFNTIDPKMGEQQTADLKIRDALGTVTSVTALVKTDKKQQTYQMTLTDGTGTDGAWHGEWTADDTHNLLSVITFTATDSAGNTASVDMTIR